MSRTQPTYKRNLIDENANGRLAAAEEATVQSIVVLPCALIIAGTSDGRKQPNETESTDLTYHHRPTEQCQYVCRFVTLPTRHLQRSQRFQDAPGGTCGRSTYLYGSVLTLEIFHLRQTGCIDVLPMPRVEFSLDKSRSGLRSADESDDLALKCQEWLSLRLRFQCRRSGSSHREDVDG